MIISKVQLVEALIDINDNFLPERKKLLLVGKFEDLRDWAIQRMMLDSEPTLIEGEDLSCLHESTRYVINALTNHHKGDWVNEHIPTDKVNLPTKLVKSKYITDDLERQGIEIPVHSYIEYDEIVECCEQDRLWATNVYHKVGVSKEEHEFDRGQRDMPLPVKLITVFDDGSTNIRDLRFVRTQSVNRRSVLGFKGNNALIEDMFFHKSYSWHTIQSELIKQGMTKEKAIKYIRTFIEKARRKYGIEMEKGSRGKYVSH